MSMAALQNLETSVLEAELEDARSPDRKPRPALVAASAGRRANTAMHGGVFKALAGINAFILGVFWLTFQGDKEALFMVAISAVYLAAYMGTPYMMLRAGGKKRDDVMPMGAFLDEPFETWTGVITGKEAALQVLLIPAAIAVAVSGMGLIIALAR